MNMEYTSVSNPIWTDSARTMIRADVVFPSIGDLPVKFNASPNDVEEHGRQIYADLVSGKYGAIAEPEIQPV